MASQSTMNHPKAMALLVLVLTGCSPEGSGPAVPDHGNAAASASPREVAQQFVKKVGAGQLMDAYRQDFLEEGMEPHAVSMNQILLFDLFRRALGEVELLSEVRTTAGHHETYGECVTVDANVVWSRGRGSVSIVLARDDQNRWKVVEPWYESDAFQDTSLYGLR